MIKRKNYHLVNFTVPGDHRVKMKEEKKYMHIVR